MALLGLQGLGFTVLDGTLSTWATKVCKTMDIHLYKIIQTAFTLHAFEFGCQESFSFAEQRLTGELDAYDCFSSPRRKRGRLHM